MRLEATISASQLAVCSLIRLLTLDCFNESTYFHISQNRTSAQCLKLERHITGCNFFLPVTRDTCERMTLALAIFCNDVSLPIKKRFPLTPEKKYGLSRLTADAKKWPNNMNRT